MTDPDRIEFEGRARTLLNDMWQEYMREVKGSARQAQWNTEDGWVVMYTTSRVVGGKHAGTFIAQSFRPDRKHKGEYIQDVRMICDTRAAAKKWATRWYREHSPKWDAKYPA